MLESNLLLHRKKRPKPRIIPFPFNRPVGKSHSFININYHQDAQVQVQEIENQKSSLIDG